jgi:hypothetical protein
LNTQKNWKQINPTVRQKIRVKTQNKGRDSAEPLKSVSIASNFAESLHGEKDVY